ncbi:MAG: GNAT family N-acetyltransferase [Myxococcota bacterium]|nr:GNAT family N-acetyltransferase [Myxococcota bacterium]
MTRLPSGRQLARPREPEELEQYLQSSPGLHLYELGDLEEPFFSRTKWWASADRDGVLEAVILEYAAHHEPVVIAMAAMDDGGEDARVYAELIDAIAPELPRRFYTHATEPARLALAAHFELSAPKPHTRMVLSERAMAESYPVDGEVSLGEEDLEELLSLYEQSYPDNAFDPRMLELEDAYTGLRRDGVLVAVAGVHVLSLERGVASLGNITVHPARRGEGLGKQVTASICRKLSMRAHRVIGLNVASHNEPAIRTYKALGFEEVVEFQEFHAQRA